jgi:hypothetical protein
MKLKRLMNERQTVFLIPEANQTGFISEICRLSRRAVKLGFAAFSPVLLTTSERTKDEWTYRVFHYQLDAAVPRINGWTFVATIDHSNEGGNLIRFVPNTGIDLPTSYRAASPICEHCNVNRFRRDTFVLHCAETGVFKQVGRTCLKDFFGHDPMAVAKYAEILSYANECGGAMEEFDFATGRNHIFLRDYLAHVATMIRENGWISRKKANEEGCASTADLALTNMLSRGSRHYVEVTAEDRAIVEQAIEWGSNLSNKHNLSDYEHNVVVVVGSSVVSLKSIGIAASVIGVYLMNRDREAQREAAAAAGGASEFYGIVGERIRNASVTVTGAFPINTSMGVLYIYTFAMGAAVLKWFTSDKNMNVGDTITISGTIKEHATYNGVKQTNLTNCRVKKS